MRSLAPCIMQAMRQQYGLSDMDLHSYGLQAISMLPANSRTIDTQAQVRPRAIPTHSTACLPCLRALAGSRVGWLVPPGELTSGRPLLAGPLPTRLLWHCRLACYTCSTWE